MKHKITKEDRKKLRESERKMYIEHNLRKKKCICATCQITRLGIQCGYWHKKYGDENKRVLKLISEYKKRARPLEKVLFEQLKQEVKNGAHN